MAFVFAPDGTPGTIPDEQLQEAVQQGFRVREPDARERAGESSGTAFLEGAFRGATAGFLEPVATTVEANLTGRTEAAVRQDKQLRREENPLATGAGELTGAIGTSVATGGGASALVGGGVKGAAFEGGLYGMGTMVSESALENTDLTAERLGVGLASGALAGGAMHGALTGIGKGASAVVGKFGGKGLKDTLTKAADELEWRSLSESNKRWATQNEPHKDFLLKFAREKGITGVWDAALDEKTVQRAQTVANDYAGRISSQMDDLERMAPLKNNDKLRMDLVNFVEKRLDDEFGMNPAFNEALKPVKAMTENIANEPTHTWKSVWDFQSSLFKDTPVTGLSPAASQVREEARQAVRDFVFDNVAAGANLPAGLSASMRKTGQEARAALAITKAIANRAGSIEASGGVLGMGSLKSLGAGALTGFATGNPLAAVAAAYGETQLRKRGGFLAATALRSIADSKVTSGVSKGLLNHFNGILSVAPEVLGAYRYPIAKAAAMGADALVAEHVRLASGPYGQDYLARAALPAESPEEVDAAGRRLAILDSVQRAADAQAEEMTAAIDGVFGSAPGRKGALGAPLSPKDFNKFRDSLYADTAQPERVFEQVPPELRAAAPSAATQAAAVALRGKQFLVSKLPKDPFEGMPVSVRPAWKPSAADLDKFSQYKEAVENPGRVLKNMAAGFVSPEQVEALKAVYPVIYSDLQQQMGERLSTWQKPLSYKQKLALSAVFGPKVLGMTPQMVAVIQQSQALANGPDSGQGSPKPPDGRQDVNEEQMQTEAEKLEAR